MLYATAFFRGPDPSPELLFSEQRHIAASDTPRKGHCEVQLALA